MSYLFSVEGFAASDHPGTVLTLRIPELHELELTDEQRAKANKIVAQVVGDMHDRTGKHPADCAWLLAAELVRLHHDEAAYRRECERRGVLAL